MESINRVRALRLRENEIQQFPIAEVSGVPLVQRPRLAARLDIASRTMAPSATAESRIPSEILPALP